MTWEKEKEVKKNFYYIEAKDFSAAVKCTLSANVLGFKTAGGPF